MIWDCKDTSFSRDTKIYFVFCENSGYFFFEVSNFQVIVRERAKNRTH